MEPVSMLAAFTAVKAGISAGQELVSLVKPLAQLFDQIDEAKSSHTKKKNKPFIMSVNEEALDTFLRKKQAEDTEADLREIVIATRGISAWRELVSLRTQIRVDRNKEKQRLLTERRENLEFKVLVGAMLFVPVFIFGVVFAVLNAL